MGECGPLQTTVVSPSDSGEVSDAAYRYFFEVGSENFPPPELNSSSLLLTKQEPEQSFECWIEELQPQLIRVLRNNVEVHLQLILE